MAERMPRTYRSVSLCLACSSSLPPKAIDVFLTPCCGQPICPGCLSSNPRLGRYNPCLSCLGGVGLIRASSSRSGLDLRHGGSLNIDGAVRDEDTFILGGDEDDEDEEDLDRVAPRESAGSQINDPPPSYTSFEVPSESVSSLSSVSSLTAPSESVHPERSEDNSAVSEPVTASPPVYYVKRGDTLQGIALRLNVNGREICRLNNLPPSTLTTTPHLLHTRTSLKLPPSARLPSKPSPPAPDAGGEARRVRERAEKRLQTLTKEVDYRVAKAYVALVDNPEEEVAYAIKYKEMGGSNAGGSNLQARAVDQYLEDEEWEEEERKAGRGVEVRSPPPLFPRKITT
ncbi:hypothetical protein HYDPIDRAFT_150338 [Hydnomerulius pinastri MD-312]|nr:hypothetical protein HYDPIDRAFT_150338 [Hydnomerulius pinastri MD-312]